MRIIVEYDEAARTWNAWYTDRAEQSYDAPTATEALGRVVEQADSSKVNLDLMEDESSERRLVYEVQPE